MENNLTYPPKLAGLGYLEVYDPQDTYQAGYDDGFVDGQEYAKENKDDE
jgi:hypothetical protein